MRRSPMSTKAMATIIASSAITITITAIWADLAETPTSTPTVADRPS